MRLIDADDLKKTYYRELNIEPGETGACYIAFGMFPRMIDNARTIKAEPKTGRWITRGDCIDCSECRNARWSRTPYEDLVKHFNYCPNCGARMESGNE